MRSLRWPYQVMLVQIGVPALVSLLMVAGEEWSLQAARSAVMFFSIGTLITIAPASLWAASQPAWRVKGFHRPTWTKEGWDSLSPDMRLHFTVNTWLLILIMVALLGDSALTWWLRRPGP